MLRRLWSAVRFPPPFPGPILSESLDGLAYLLGWPTTFARIALWVVVSALGLHQPWKTVSTVASIVVTLLLPSIVILTHRRRGDPTARKLPRSVVRQSWLGP